MNEKKIDEPKKIRFEHSKLLTIFSMILTILFYSSIFIVFLLVVVIIIIFFVKVDIHDMILPPFMKKVLNDSGEIINYKLFIGNGIKIDIKAEDITLNDIKTVIYAGSSVLIAILLTIIPICKFLLSLIRNIKNHFFREIKNIHYIYFIGISMFLGGRAINFVTGFYNYELISTFIKDTSNQIELSLYFDFGYGLPGILIIFLGFLINYIFKNLNFTSDIPHENTNANTEIVPKDDNNSVIP